MEEQGEEKACRVRFVSCCAITALRAFPPSRSRGRAAIENYDTRCSLVPFSLPGRRGRREALSRADLRDALDKLKKAKGKP